MYPVSLHQTDLCSAPNELPTRGPRLTGQTFLYADELGTAQKQYGQCKEVSHLFQAIGWHLFCHFNEHLFPIQDQMSKTGSLDRLDGQHFTPVALQAVIWAMAPGQDTTQGGSRQSFCREMGSQHSSTGVWGRETVE